MNFIKTYLYIMYAFVIVSGELSFFPQDQVTNYILITLIQINKKNFANFN
jgi:hypothetical protein